MKVVHDDYCINRIYAAYRIDAGFAISEIECSCLRAARLAEEADRLAHKAKHENDIAIVRQHQ